MSTRPDDAVMVRRRRGVLAILDRRVDDDELDTWTAHRIARIVQRAEPLEITLARVNTVLRSLESSELIERAGRGKRGRILWRLTDRGVQFLELTDELPIESEAVPA